MDPAERQRRVQELAEEIFARKAELGHDSPIPSFLNLFTEKIVDLEDRIDKIEAAQSTPELDITVVKKEKDQLG